MVARTKSCSRGTSTPTSPDRAVRRLAACGLGRYAREVAHSLIRATVCADAHRWASASPAFSTRDTVDTLTPTSSAIIRNVTGAGGRRPVSPCPSSRPPRNPGWPASTARAANPNGVRPRNLGVSQTLHNRLTQRFAPIDCVVSTCMRAAPHSRLPRTRNGPCRTVELMPRVVVLATGGTISSRRTNGAVTAVDDAAAVLAGVELSDDIAVEQRDVLRVGSYRMSFADLRTLADEVDPPAGSRRRRRRGDHPRHRHAGRDGDPARPHPRRRPTRGAHGRAAGRRHRRHRRPTQPARRDHRRRRPRRPRARHVGGVRRVGARGPRGTQIAHRRPRGVHQPGRPDR